MDPLTSFRAVYRRSGSLRRSHRRRSCLSQNPTLVRPGTVKPARKSKSPTTRPATGPNKIISTTLDWGAATWRL